MQRKTLYEKAMRRNPLLNKNKVTIVKSKSLLSPLSWVVLWYDGKWRTYYLSSLDEALYYAKLQYANKKVA